MIPRKISAVPKKAGIWSVCGCYSPRISRTISVEPFFNELLELPECAFDQFVSFVEKTMAEYMSEG